MMDGMFLGVWRSLGTFDDWSLGDLAVLVVAIAAFEETSLRLIALLFDS